MLLAGDDELLVNDDMLQLFIFSIDTYERLLLEKIKTAFYMNGMDTYHSSVAIHITCDK